MRPAVAADRPAVEAFLRARADGSMFLLASLLDPGALAGPEPLRLWLAEGPRGAAGVLGLSPGGTLMPQWPDADWAETRPLLAGLEVRGAHGPADQVRPLLAALGLDGLGMLATPDEPRMVLDLAGLRLPEGPGGLLADGAGDPGLVARWRAAFKVELNGASPERAAREAEAEVSRGLGGDRFRLLAEGGEALALCGLNARAPSGGAEDLVQVGRVYVPPPLRGRGHARRAVGLLLAEARARGARRAVLAASGPAAERAYLSLGFSRAGWVGSVEFDPPRLVAPALPTGARDA